MVVALLLFLAVDLHAQIHLRNPGFPTEESITYLKTMEERTDVVEVNMRLIEDADRPYYEYRFYSDERDILAGIDPDTLTVSFSEVWEKKNESTVHKTNEILRNEKEAGPGQLLITDSNGFDVSLRGFPWEEHDSAEFVFLNGPSSDRFRLEMKVKGTEVLDINDSTYRCYKVQVGLDGVLGSLFPKSYFWYTVAPPHYLVRTESSSVGGSDEYEMEILSYTRRN